MIPIAPVRATCVPPHAETSKASTSINRSTPSRFDSFRSDSFAASSASANRMVTGRSSQTMRLASSSARVISPAVTSRARSIVDEVVPRWKLTVLTWSTRSNAADSTCWPVCCCMCSKRRGQSIFPRTGPLADFPFDHVDDAAVVFIDDLDDAGAAERASIERLAAGRGIERRAVEHDALPGRGAGSGATWRTVASNSVAYGSV